MIRTDRKTGEPILSPKLTADQLHAMANDPGWRPWMRLIAEHPHAWPALIDWWHNAQRQGFDAAGAAPKPPESMRRRRRVAIPSAPLPPEDEPGQEPVPASMEPRRTGAIPVAILRFRFFPRTGNGTVPSRRFRGEGPEGRRW